MPWSKHSELVDKNDELMNMYFFINEVFLQCDASAFCLYKVVGFCGSAFMFVVNEK